MILLAPPSATLQSIFFFKNPGEGCLVLEGASTNTCASAHAHTRAHAALNLEMTIKGLWLEEAMHGNVARGQTCGNHSGTPSPHPRRGFRSPVAAVGGDEVGPQHRAARGQLCEGGGLLAGHGVGDEADGEVQHVEREGGGEPAPNDWRGTAGVGGGRGPETPGGVRDRANEAPTVNPL